MGISRRLLAVWSFLDFLYFTSAVILIVVPLVWESEQRIGVQLKFVLPHRFLTDGLVLGSLVLASWLLSLAAIALYRHRAVFFAFNISLIAVALATVVVGCIVWVFTLTERSDYFNLWVLATPEVQQGLQDKLSCCGYFNATTAGAFTTLAGFCAQPMAAMMAPGCVNQITAAADYTLNNVFSSVFGFGAIQASLFLITVAVMNARAEEVRFRRIDEKYGQAFV